MVEQPPSIVRLNSREGFNEQTGNEDKGQDHAYAFRITGSDYQVERDTDPLLATPAIRVFKSTDGGLNWSSMDEANAPPAARQTYDIVLDSNGTTIWILYQAGSSFPSPFRVIAFDTLTDTWGVASANGPSVSARTGPYLGSANCRVIKVASGDIWAFYDIQDGGANTTEIRYSVLSGGVWGVEQVFVAPVADREKSLRQAFIDTTTNLIHVIWTDGPRQTSPASFSFFHQTITVGGVISATDTIFTTPVAASLVDYIHTPGRSLVWPEEDVLIVPYTSYASPTRATVYVGTPIAAPVWTPVVIDNLAWPTTVGDRETYAFLDSARARLYLAWFHTNNVQNQWYNPADPEINQLYTSFSDDGVTWSVPELLFDFVLYPLPGSPTNVLHCISLSKVAAADTFSAIAVACEFLATCTGFALVACSRARSVSAEPPA